MPVLSYRAILSIMLFFLLWEWLRPLIEMSEMTDLYIAKPFLVAISCFLFMDAIRMSGWIGWPLKLLICLLIVGYFFNQGFIIDLSWWNPYIEACQSDVNALLQGQFNLISAENRTLLFLIGWALMIYAVQALMFYRHSGGWFVFATFTYLVVLQLWTGLDTTAGIMRTFALGFALIALLNKLHIAEQFQTNKTQGFMSTSPRSWSWMWVGTCIIMIGTSMTAGIYLSKSEASELKPLEWNFKEIHFSADSYTKEAQGGIKAKSAYGNDDTVLGGRIEQDDQIVFTAKTNIMTRWRGEAKVYYDGKGWAQPWKLEYNKPVDTAKPDPVDSANLTESLVTQEILFNRGMGGDILFTGGNLVEFQGIVTEKGQVLSNRDVGSEILSGSHKILNGKIDKNSEDKISFYRMTSALPQTSRDHRKNIADAIVDAIDKDVYLQLPKSLPSRIQKLAKEVIGDAVDPNEQALRIERFLSKNYKYSLKPDYPRDGEDFVDHFLFGQKLGYCDYFSTAMVVMLRSVGIPARWVKGYGPGEEVTSEAEEVTSPGADAPVMKTVIVRNLDAHSWVEAYHPEMGWVSYDPTPKAAIDSPNQDLTISSLVAGMPKMNHEMLTNHWKSIIMIFAVFLLVGLAFWSGRKEMLLWLSLRNIQKSGKRSEKSGILLEQYWLKILHRFGDIQPSQTVREYVKGLKLTDETQRLALAEFAQMYESIRYNSQPQRDWMSKQHVLDVWRRII